MNKKILLLLDRDNDFFAKHYKAKEMTISRIYKNISLILKAFRRLHLKLNLPFYDLWFNEKWIKNLKQYHTVILHASIIKMPVIRYINKKYPQIRVIFWYWNPVDKILPIKKIKNLNCELWSFDADDCKKYCLKENTQFYFSEIEFEENNILEYDILFVGKDKGRLQNLLQLKNEFQNMGLKCNFTIVSDYKFFNFKKNYKYNNAIPYERILELLSKSVAVLDFVSKGQYGLTLRPLEAIFFKKKLITNNTEIKNIDFYHSDNIFILGMDKLEDLPEFIKKPYVGTDKRILAKYDFSNWLGRFLEE
jgi:hypothetical protein